MTKEEQIDWLCRLRSEIYVYMPKEWLIPMNNALDMAISALSENKGEWVPISERLPEIGQRVLATIVFYDEESEVRETMYDKYGFMCGNATAWQPLPEPYKAEKGGE